MNIYFFLIEIWYTDPEEMKRAQEEMRSQGVPSIANLIPGATRTN